MKIDLTNVVIKTERITLRLFKESDLNDFYEYCKVTGVGENAGWLPHKSIEESKFILDKFLEKKSDFAVVYNGKVIGSLGIKKDWDKESFPKECFEKIKDKKLVEIGYVLSKDYWGQGIMTECCKAVISWLFENTDVDGILCGHFDYNNRSRRVIEKCGFVYLCQTLYKTQYGKVENALNYVILRNNHN